MRLHLPDMGCRATAIKRPASLDRAMPASL